MKYILSLDGGGVKAVIQLYFLYYLELDLLKKTGKTIYETFDMYAGTSAGAIVVGAIVYTSAMTMKDVIDRHFTEEHFKRIFKQSLFNRICGSFTRPKYDLSEKFETIQGAVSDKLLEDSNNKHVMITVYSLDQQEAKFFKSYEKDLKRFKKEYKNFNDKNFNDGISVAEIINASSAAPTYFGSGKYTDETGEHFGADGGLFDNNCTTSVYADALRLYGPKEDIRILSIGTGDHVFNPIGSESQSWGPLQWITMGSFIDLVIDVDQDTADYKTKHFAEALGHKYIRVHNKINIALDDITKIDELKEIGHKWYLDTKDKLFNDFF